jgi:hypothetical protein
MPADDLESGAAQLLGNGGKIEPYTRAFRMSESESTDFSEVRVRKFWTLKTLRTRTQRVCLFTHLYCKSQHFTKKFRNFKFFFLKILLFPL